MARAQDQRRWRASTTRKRIEVYLPEDRAAELDALAFKRGESRATVIVALIAEAAAVSDTATQTDEAQSKPKPEPADAARSDPVSPTPSSVLLNAVGSAAEQGRTTASRYAFRRPHGDDERRYQWIAVVDGGMRIALGSDPTQFHRWRGVVLDGSLYIKEAKGRSRDDVVARLLDWC